MGMLDINLSWNETLESLGFERYWGFSGGSAWLLNKYPDQCYFQGRVWFEEYSHILRCSTYHFKTDKITGITQKYKDMFTYNVNTPEELMQLVNVIINKDH